MTRILVTGFRDSIRDLYDALAQQPEIELVDVSGYDPAAGVDLVLHAAAQGAIPHDDLARIRESTPAPIVLLVERADPSLFEEALEADIADVVVMPEPAERVAFTLRRVARSAQRLAALPDEDTARLLTVFSPKGGTGKTVISTSLATSIARNEGLRTLLLDFDLQFGDAAIMLGVDPEKTLHDLVTAPGELDAEKFSGYLTRHPQSGVDVLAAPLRPEDGETVTEEKVERVLEVARKAYDVIIVDTSPFFQGAILATLDRTNVLVMVCSPEIPTLKNVRLGIDTLRLISFPDERIRLCLNRADADAAMRKPQIEGALGLDVSYQLPNVPDVPAAVNRGTPLTIEAPSGQFALAIRSMSRSLLGAAAKRAPESTEAHGGREVIHAVRGLASGWLSRDGKAVVDRAGEPT
jgi:pilus assembly protein CpaE